MINNVHQPIYIHCLNGSEVTSLVIACLRKLQCWSISSIMAEFRRYCLVKPSHTSFIETFHLEIEVVPAIIRADGGLQKHVHVGYFEVWGLWGRRG